MNTELAIPEGVVVHPATGETKQLAELDGNELRTGIEQMDALALAVREAKARLSEEALRRKNAGQPVDRVNVSRRTSWNAGETGAALDKLERDGSLTAPREHYLKEEQTYKPIGRNLTDLYNQLVADGEIEAAGVLATARRLSTVAKVAAA